MNNIPYFLLSIAAIFTYCTGMTDTHIQPKWLCTLGMVAVVEMIEGLFILSGKQRRMKGLSLFTAVAFLCLCQAVYAIIQAIGLCPSLFSYRVVGSFDNPAGLAASRQQILYLIILYNIRVAGAISATVHCLHQQLAFPVILPDCPFIKNHHF